MPISSDNYLPRINPHFSSLFLLREPIAGKIRVACFCRPRCASAHRRPTKTVRTRILPTLDPLATETLEKCGLNPHQNALPSHMCVYTIPRERCTALVMAYIGAPKEKLVTKDLSPSSLSRGKPNSIRIGAIGVFHLNPKPAAARSLLTSILSLSS